MNYPECDIFPRNSRQWIICSNSAGLPIAKVNAYRKKWGIIALPSDIVEVLNSKEQLSAEKAELIFHGHSVPENDSIIASKPYGPGTELLIIYADAGVPTCDACKDLANRMNNLGPSGCQLLIKDIVAEIMPRAMTWLNQKHPWIMKLLPNVVSETGAYTKIHSDVMTAIKNCEDVMADRRAKRLDVLTGEEIKGCQSCSGSRDPLPNKVPQSLMPVTEGTTAFSVGSPPYRFITMDQYTADIMRLVKKIPHDIDYVAGVARSGLFPASAIAMLLHKPMIIISQTSGRVIPAGSGWRLNDESHIQPKDAKILVVDDTTMTGASNKMVRHILSDRYKEVVYASVYCNPHAIFGKPDIFEVELEWPHLLEWNLFNSVLSKSTAMDFDGVLCHDCPADADDDGEKYIDFIKNAMPLYCPKKQSVPLIVTARIEKYREPTEGWLKKQGIAFDKLVMHPAKTTRERELDDIAAYKAKHFKNWSDGFIPDIGPNIFIESDDGQAQRIAEITKLLVVCPSTGKVY
jgi:adenine/guanine phosphoribosyltransferase-like PRPP-binding protein